MVGKIVRGVVLPSKRDDCPNIEWSKLMSDCMYESKTIKGKFNEEGGGE